MSDEYNNTNEEMENGSLNENQNENKETRQEPGEIPTPENPCYARSYKKEEAGSDDMKIEEPKMEEQKQEEKKEYQPYQFSAPNQPQQPKKKKQSSGLAKKLGMTAAVAAVFGLVAGGVFLGVNYVGNEVVGPEKVPIDNTPVTDGKTVEGADAINNIETTGNTVADVAKNVMPSIVAITGISIQEIPNYFGFGVQAQTVPSSGSGIIVGQNDEELLIATNKHVVADTESITVCFTNQDGTAASTGENNLEDTAATDENSTDLEAGTAVEAQIKGTDADNDLAVIAVKIADIPADVLSQIKVATIGSSDDMIIGEQVVAIGNALGYGQSVTSGYVSALNKRVSSDNIDSTFIQTDAAINPGNSGGALLNMKGELVGINSSKIASNEVEGMGFAIPISRAEPILDNLMSKKTRSKVEDENKAAYLGITCKNVTAEASQMYNMPTGVFVDSVVEDGPAEEAGIQAGDIIRKIDGTSISTNEGLIEQLQYYEAGEEIDFVVSRANGGEYKEETITVELGAKKDAPSTSGNPILGNR